MPKISVIVPVYRVEPYLHRCVDSILDQTFTDFELILVDDGSPDECGAICDAYQMKDNRVVVIHKPNGGVSSARNAGLDIARGEYMTFVDSDDWIDASFFEKSIAAVKKDNSELFITGFYITNLEETILQTSVISHPIRIKNGNLNQEEKYILLSKSYIAGPWGKLYHRDVIGQIRFDCSLCYGEDLKFVFSVLDNCNRITALSESYYYYRTNPLSVMKTITEWKCESVRRTARFLLDDCIRQYGLTERIYRKKLCERYIYDCNVQLKLVQDGKYSLSEKYRMISKLLDDDNLKKEYEEFNIHQRFFSFHPFKCLLFLEIRKALNHVKALRSIRSAKS